MGGRSAEYAIRGFYHQFLVAVSRSIDLLGESSINAIYCEATEDVDVETKEGMQYLQVKTSINQMNVYSNSLRKSLLNFYETYLEEPSALFVLVTNSSPGREVIDKQERTTLADLEKLRKSGWSDKSKFSEVTHILKDVIKEYAEKNGKEVDFNKFDESFLMLVILQFHDTTTEDYELRVIQKLKEHYPKANSARLQALFLGILHTVIHSSIATELKNKRIDSKRITSLVTRTDRELGEAYKDIILTDEHKKISFTLAELSSGMQELLDLTSDTNSHARRAQNLDLIPRVDVPQKKKELYDEFPFVKKMNDAHILPLLVSGAKDDYYQADYAIQKTRATSSTHKDKELNRMKDGVKHIYISEYVDATQTNLKNSNLFLNKVQTEIRREHQNILASSLPLDFFHKIGLLHHVSNDDDEVIWKLIK